MGISSVEIDGMYTVFVDMPVTNVECVSFKIGPVHPLDDTLTELIRLRDKAKRKKTKKKYQNLIDPVWETIQKDTAWYYDE